MREEGEQLKELLKSNGYLAIIMHYFSASSQFHIGQSVDLLTIHINNVFSREGVPTLFC